jgi:hypothetical protein
MPAYTLNYISARNCAMGRRWYDNQIFDLTLDTNISDNDLDIPTDLTWPDTPALRAVEMPDTPSPFRPWRTIFEDLFE